MSEVQRVGDLEIAQDHHDQQLTWTLQRWLWLVMAAAVVAGSLGVFGLGPLSDSRAKAGGGSLELDYSRFTRHLTSTDLRFRLHPGASDETRLWLTDAYLHEDRIERIDPQPVRVEAGPERLAYVFRLAEPDRPITATFHLKVLQLGKLEGLRTA